MRWLCAVGLHWWAKVWDDEGQQGEQCLRCGHSRGFDSVGFVWHALNNTRRGRTEQ